MAMYVYGMVGHGQVTNAHANLVAQLDVEGVNARKQAAVPRPQVKVNHGHDFWRGAAGLNVVGVEQETEVSVHLANVVAVLLGVCDPRAHHAHGHLRHFIGMWVVHECARAARYKLIHKGFTGSYGWLVQAGYTVHPIGQALTVPMHAGVLRQAVGHKQANLVTLYNLNGGSR